VPAPALHSAVTNTPSEIAALMHLIVNSDPSSEIAEQSILFRLILDCYEAGGAISPKISPILSVAWDIYCDTDY
jgi:hypothetical protein